MREELVESGLLRVREACIFLGLQRATLYKLMGEGRLPFCKIGHSRRIPKRAVVELAAECLVVKESGREA